jgi:hypothetical protein
MVAGSAERRHRALERGDRGVAGVTRYLDETAPAVDESSAAESGTLRTLRERFEEHRASWPGSEVRGGYSRDFVVEELVAAAARGEPLWELGRRLGGPDGAETAAALPLRRDAAPFEKVPEAAARSGR